MSSKPSPHLPPPVAPPSAAEADPQPQPTAPTSEPPKVMHRARAAPIVYRRRRLRIPSIRNPSGRDSSDRGGGPSMSPNPSPHLPPPVSPPGAAEADPQRQPAAPTSEPPLMHRTRAIDFLGRRASFICQNDNGPSPLLAMCNNMLLKDVIRLDPDAGEVSQERLIALVSKHLIDSGNMQGKDHNGDRFDAVNVLPCLTTVRRVHNFEFTRERFIFDLLKIPLYHEWMMDPKAYNALDSEPTTTAVKLPSVSNEVASQQRRGDLEEEEQLMRVLNLSKTETGRLHVDEQKGQTTDTEVTCDSHAKPDPFSSQELSKGEISVLFDNGHFNTVWKYNGNVYVLATDESFISQTGLIWKTLDEVRNDVLAPCKAKTPRYDSSNDQQAMTSTADCNPGFDNFTSGKKQVLQLVNEHEDRCKGNSSSDIHRMYPCYGGKEKRIYTIPKNLYEILKPHQKKGLDWLWKIHCKDTTGGMVADDMGLGKTLQMTAFLSGLYHSNIIERVMIVAPLSVLSSWAKELKRSGLERRVQDYYDSGDRALQIIKEEGGILLLPYILYQSEHEALIKLKWDYVILDEAHKIKNVRSNITSSTKKLKCQKKILLTGTPVMKDLMDMFSMLEFMNPKVLGSKKLFRKNYMKPVLLGQYMNSTNVEKEECMKALARFWRKTSPYILRRTKDVLIESGELRCKKHDVLIWLRLTPLQIRDGGGRVIKKMANELLDSIAVDEEKYRNTENSCKLSFLLDLVEKLFEEEKLNKDLFEQKKKEGLVQWKNLKILIFSQQIQMLIRIKDTIQHIVPDGAIIQMDGKTEKDERDMIVENFNSCDGPSILLLTAKVGGEGLNLTAATKVGLILGKQFKNLKAMREESGALSIEYIDKEKMLKIIGLQETVDKVKALVIEKVSKSRNQQWVSPRQRPRYIIQPPHPGPPGHGVQAPPLQGPPAQSHGGNGRVLNWNRGSLAYPQAPDTYAGQMYLSFRDYNNPYRPINYSNMDGTLQPASGTIGRKLVTQGNVLLATIENMQYAVTVDVLHAVFSSFGTVQKIVIFEKNGRTQALIQYPYVNTAAVVKQALEGHCIFDGGYCKLHLSYSHHTDLNVKAHGDKSRDYTIPAGVIQGVPQPPGVQATSSGWQDNLLAAGAYAPPSAPAQSHGAIAQVQSWNPSNSSAYPPAPGTYPGQMYLSPPQYATFGGFPNAPSTAPAQYETSVGFTNTPSTAPPWYAVSGGFPNTPTGAPPGPPQQVLTSQQMLQPQHVNQSRGTPGTSQQLPPPSYYR